MILVSATSQHRVGYILDVLVLIDLSLTDAESPDNSGVFLRFQFLEQGGGELFEASRVFC